MSASELNLRRTVLLSFIVIGFNFFCFVTYDKYSSIETTTISFLTLHPLLKKEDGKIFRGNFLLQHIYDALNKKNDLICFDLLLNI